jgi:uncharacterized protein YukE
MTSIHMQTESVYSSARQMAQSATQADAALQSLQRAMQGLDYIWQGGSSDEFSAQAQEMLRLMGAKNEELVLLAERVKSEVTEWEQVDQRGAASMRGIGSFPLLRQTHFALSAGGGQSEVPFYNNTILPIFTALSAVPLLSGLPGWLDSFLDKYFPEHEIKSPIPEEDAPASTPLSTTFGDLLNEPPPVTEPAQPTETPTYETHYDMPPKAQGNLYGSAACSPTSVSMVTDYYHAQNKANNTITPSDLIDMLDKGDGTPGSGMSLSNLTDELGDIGYKNISQKVNANITDLQSELIKGPVIVTTGVKLIGGEARDIQKAGSTIHAMVIKGVSADNVAVNDPWSGAEKVFSRATFDQMWSNGSNGMFAIRP